MLLYTLIDLYSGATFGEVWARPDEARKANRCLRRLRSNTRFVS
jgi:hypothetical protein